MNAALEGIRVLDLATPLAEATGRVLADLGAEVIKVEPPGGCGARFAPPFTKGGAGDPEGSLFWRTWGLGKRSVVLDLEDEADRERLRSLAEGADILIESFTPGHMASLGLGPDTLRAANPALLYVSVSPFGQTGPHALHPATDLTLSASGGLLNMQGDGDRPPVPVGVPETAHLGATQAAADVIMALYARNRDGQGQHLDTATQAAVLWSLMYVTDYAAFGEDPPLTGADRAQRTGTQGLVPGLDLPSLEPCKDGHVVMVLVLGTQGAVGFDAVMRYIGEQGGLDADLMEVDWLTWLEQFQAGTLPLETVNRGIEQFKAHLLTMTKTEIQEEAIKGKWLISPAYTTQDLLDDPQLDFRDFWIDVEGDKLPGPFARLGGTPIRYRSAAPKLGADQDLADDTARTPAAPTSATLAPREQIFEGLKVADLSWIAAGPLITKDLANLGATVVRVETETRVDTLRVLPPHKDGQLNLRTCHTYSNMNQSKWNLALDYSKPEAMEVAYRLVEWADVVVENFTPGTAERIGLDYDTLRKRNPNLVMLYTCMRGQTGPERAHTGFGLHGAALAGLVAITGWPDRKPQAPWGAYTDFISPRYALAALAAALYHRDRTGEGQCIDVSQIEAAIHYLAPAILDYTHNGRVVERAGHDSDWGAPHGVYATAGTQRYVAIETRSVEQWQALCGEVPALAALDDASCATHAGRTARHKEIDAALAAWCAERDPFEQAQQLREAGVPAYVVLRATDFHGDPQLEDRGFFIELDHVALGPMKYDGAVTVFSDLPARPLHAGPVIGQHTFEVLRDTLGYDEEQIAELAAAGALS